ncbi:uncharacterized protein EDB91DRAFT_1052877 [Suillus paluster]|uniref:uncharacterized protein n=1 Tax=Suillus paluster TaxID=48578 RepID=UPI001B861EE0|nr:uncharacterized protein EDB91DRAFT_1052877 [Suillus paluster]KAG1740810.1 hypothetical protein EDB91DRAFT_1052877 [Suillus paluster]
MCLSDVHYIKQFPSDFLHIQCNGALVRERVQQVYQSSPDQLESMPQQGKILLPLSHLPSGSVPAGMPPHLAMRYEHFVSELHQGRLLRRWDDVIATHPKHHLKADGNRSTTDAFHFGVWEVTASKPRLTRETREQSPEAKKAIDELLGYVQSFIAPNIGTALEQHAPLHAEAMAKAHSRVRQHLKQDLLLRPMVDMGGSFFAVAVKEFGSGVVHIDWNDSCALYAYIFAVGDWEGGEFCIPQLGIKIPVRPGQVLAVLARVLAHFSAPVTSGRCIVFTCFTDALLFEHSHPDVVVVGH